MSKNYLETLRFTLILNNLNNQKFNPTITVGLNNLGNHEFNLLPGINKFLFDEKVYEPGKTVLSVKVKEVEQPWNISGFVVEDLLIHGISVTHQLYQCEYYPHYDQDYLLENPLAPKIIKSGLHIGNRGTWNWHFTAPINENISLKFGLW